MGKTYIFDAAPAVPAPVVTASVASAPIPLVSFPGKNPGDAAGLAEHVFVRDFGKT
jgi:hypothetical protein